MGNGQEPHVLNPAILLNFCALIFCAGRGPPFSGRGNKRGDVKNIRKKGLEISFSFQVVVNAMQVIEELVHGRVDK